MRRVTQILTLNHLREWPPHMSQEDREWCMGRGKMVHKGTELFDRGTLDWGSLDPRIEPYIRGWEKFRKEAGGKIIGIEVKVKSVRYDYEGTLDRLIINTNLAPKKTLLLDIKTNLADEATALQTAGYAMAWGKYGAKCARGSVALKDDGTYRYTPYPDDSLDKAAWMGCLQLAAWKARRGMK